MEGICPDTTFQVETALYHAVAEWLRERRAAPGQRRDNQGKVLGSLRSQGPWKPSHMAMGRGGRRKSACEEGPEAQPQVAGRCSLPLMPPGVMAPGWGWGRTCLSTTAVVSLFMSLFSKVPLPTHSPLLPDRNGFVR